MPISDIRNKVLPEIDVQRKKAEDAKLQFTGLNEQQLIARLLPRSSQYMQLPMPAPMIIWQGWTATLKPGEIVTYACGVYNPLPTIQSWMFAYAFIGPANFIHDPAMAVQTADMRFAPLCEPGFPGLQVLPGATATLQFEMKVPKVEPTNYLGNTLLFRGEWHDVGAYVDRGLWPFLVKD